MSARLGPVLTSVILACCAPAFLTASPLYGVAKDGKLIYDKSCKECHGTDGRAADSTLPVKERPGPLGDRGVQSQGDAELKKTITAGKGKMAAVRGVGGKDLEDLIAYIRTLK